MLSALEHVIVISELYKLRILFIICVMCACMHACVCACVCVSVCVCVCRGQIVSVSGQCDKDRSDLFPVHSLKAHVAILLAVFMA